MVAGVCRSQHDNVWNCLSGTVPPKIMLIRYKRYVQDLWIDSNCTWNGVVPSSYTDAFILHLSWKFITPFPPYQGWCIILCSQPVSNDRTHSSHCWGWVAELLLMVETITRLSKCIFQGIFLINNAWPAPAAATWMEVSIHQMMLIHPFQQHNPFIPPLDVDASTIFDGSEVHRRRISIY